MTVLSLLAATHGIEESFDGCSDDSEQSVTLQEGPILFAQGFSSQLLVTNALETEFLLQLLFLTLSGLLNLLLPLQFSVLLE